MSDCFSGLKQDLTDESDVGGFINDFRQAIQQKVITPYTGYSSYRQQTALLEDPALRDSMVVLGNVLKNAKANTTGLSKSARIAASREARKIDDIVHLIDINRQYMWSSSVGGMPFRTNAQMLEDLNFLNEKFENQVEIRKLFGADFPGVNVDGVLVKASERVRGQIVTRIRNARVEALPFNLINGSRKDRSDYLKTLQVPYVAQMDKDTQIAYIQAHLMRDVPGQMVVARNSMAQITTDAQAAWQLQQDARAASRAAKLGQPVPPKTQPVRQVVGGVTPPVPVTYPEMPAPLEFRLAPNQPVLPGINTKYSVIDQYGRDWILKPSHPGMPLWRIEGEDSSHRLGNLLGFNTAEGQINSVDHPGRGRQKGAAQRLFDNVLRDTHGLSVTSLSPQERQDLADEHLLDWFLSNHDGHDEQFLRLATGRLVGIDKGQSYKFFGKDKLELDWKPPQNAKPIYYNQLYHAIIDKKISRAEADDIVRNALARAASMEMAPDADIAAEALRGLKNRDPNSLKPGFVSGSGLVGVGTTAKNIPDLVKQIVDRKNNLVDDFKEFYKDIYAKAGYTWDGSLEPNQTAPPFHSGVSARLFKEVADTEVHGVPAFYAGEDIEDGSMLFWQEHWKNTGPTVTGTEPVLRAELKLRDAADKRVTKWLNEHLGQNAGVQAPKGGVPELRHEPTWWTLIEHAARATNSHVSDPSYFSTPLAQTRNAPFVDMKTTIEKELRQLKRGVLSSADLGYATGSSDIDRKAFIEHEKMLEMYLKYIQDIETARVAGGRIYRTTRFDFTPIPPDPNVPIPSAVKMKVTKAINSRQRGAFSAKTGKLTVDPKTPDVQSGQMFVIEIRPGLELEYRPWARAGVYDAVPLSQQGLMRLAAHNFQGLAPDDMQTVYDALAEMGLPIKPMTLQDMELQYWRMQYGVLQDSSDSMTRYGAVTGKIRSELARRRNIPIAEEIEIYKSGFAAGPDSRASIDNADFMPHFSRTHLESDTPTGKPYWHRFNVTAADIERATKGMFPKHLIANPNVMLDIVQSGQLLSTEERTRVLGGFMNGRHSSSDQESGGASYVFASLAGSAPRGDTGTMMYLSPHTLRRSSNFHFPSMQQGRISSRKANSKFQVAGYDTTSSWNAIHYKNSISILDDVEVIVFADARTRDAAILAYAQAGIREIRGVPVATRFVVRGAAVERATAAAWAAIRARGGVLTE